MSSLRDSQNGEGEAGDNDDVVAMDTTPTTPTATDATSIWDVARQNSSKMVLQSVMDDMEHRAAKQKEELQQLRRRAEDAESGLMASRQTIEGLEANLLQQGETTRGLEKKVRDASAETEVLRESIQAERERADRSGAESDRLREEIRYVRFGEGKAALSLWDAKAAVHAHQIAKRKNNVCSGRVSTAERFCSGKNYLY